jgi:hypothetical protein
MKFRTPYNAHELPKQREHNTMPSMTVPDQTMSIKEIFRRFAQGLPIEGQKVPVYDDEYIPDVTKMDLADVQRLREENADYIKSMQERLQKPKRKTEIETLEPIQGEGEA